MHRFTFDNSLILIPKEADLKYLYIEITNRCNLKCKMCFKQYWEDEEGNMDYSLFLKILDDAEDFPELEMIYFGGIGEPTVHPRFMDMVREVKKRGYALGMSTNGFLLTDKVIKELVKLETDLIYISLDTIPTQETRIGHIMPSVAVDRIKKIVEEKRRQKKDFPHIGVEVVVTKENYWQMAEIADYLGELGIDVLLFSNIIPIEKHQADQIVYDGSVDMQHYLDELHAKAYKHFLLKLPEFKLRTERHCDFIEKKVAVVRWDGEVAPCYRFLHTYPEIILAGKRRFMHIPLGMLSKNLSKRYGRGEIILGLDLL